jgi:hypothetical protein
MGTLLLGRQLVGVLALALSDAAYRHQLPTGSPASATGHAVAWIAGGGALVAGLALLGLRGGLPDASVTAASSRAPRPVVTSNV